MSTNTPERRAAFKATVPLGRSLSRRIRSRRALSGERRRELADRRRARGRRRAVHLTDRPRPIWLHLEGAAFGAKSLVKRGWKSLDFLGFSRQNLAVSMAYDGFSTNSFSASSAAGTTGSRGWRLLAMRLILSKRRFRSSGP
jgi:hypothetical protein